jgi:transposase IS66-like protein
MNGVDSRAYLSDVVDKIVNEHRIARINELLPWAYPPETAFTTHLGWSARSRTGNRRSIFRQTSPQSLALLGGEQTLSERRDERVSKAICTFN